MTLIKMEDGSYIVSDKIVEVKKQVTEEEGKIFVVDMNGYLHLYFSISMNDIKEDKEKSKDVYLSLCPWDFYDDKRQKSTNSLVIEKLFDIMYKEVDEAMAELTEKILM